MSTAIKTIETLLKTEKIESKEEEIEIEKEMVEPIGISKSEDLSPYNLLCDRLDKHYHQYTFAWTILTHIYRTIIYKYHSKRWKSKLRNL